MRYDDVAIPLSGAWASPCAKRQGSLGEVSRLGLAANPAGFPLERMNGYGCSLIFGHPQGLTGLRSIAEPIEELRSGGDGTGLFTGCAAGDTGAAVVVRVAD